MARTAESKLLDGQQARAFGKRYVQLKEALLREGVKEPEAREEARAAATLVYLAPEYSDPTKPCPTCGRSHDEG